MSEDTPAPKLAPTIAARLPQGLAKSLTWYQAAATGGVLAPSSWTCRAISGSSGSTLYVGPPGTRFDEAKITGSIIVKSFFEGGTSGRFTVAAVAARAFPAFKAFALRVKKEGIAEEPMIVFAPFAHDHTSRLSDREVTYQTAAGEKGLGTMQNIASGASPISGLAFMSGKTTEPVLMLLQVRLDPKDAELTPAIVDNVRQSVALGRLR